MRLRYFFIILGCAMISFALAIFVFYELSKNNVILSGLLFCTGVYLVSKTLRKIKPAASSEMDLKKKIEEHYSKEDS